MIKKLTSLMMVAMALCVVAPRSSASLLTIDEILFQGPAGNGAILTGTVDATVSGNILTLVVTNTTASITLDGAGASNLLTGVGFQLPTGFSITGGTATVNLGSIPSLPAVTDVSKEWGYSNSPISNGHFDGSPSVLTYNQVVGTVASDVNTQFAAGSLSGAPGMNGPDFGLLSSAVSTATAGGQVHAKSPLTITLTLNQAVTAGNEAAFINTLNSGHVGLAFGSPTASNLVPEPGTLAIFGLGLACLVGATSRRRVR